MRRMTRAMLACAVLGIVGALEGPGPPRRLLVMRTALAALGMAALVAACVPWNAPGAPVTAPTVPPVIGPPISLTGVEMCIRDRGVEGSAQPEAHTGPRDPHPRVRHDRATVDRPD